MFQRFCEFMYFFSVCANQTSLREVALALICCCCSAVDIETQQLILKHILL